MTEELLKRYEQEISDWGFVETNPAKELIAEIRRLKAALKKYGRHIDPCPDVDFALKDCQCGFDAAMDGK